jgi:hypothetical protein
LTLRTAISRIFALLAILALAQIPAGAQPPREPVQQRIEIKSTAIEAFDPRNPATRRFGLLEFRGGLVLDSPSKDFGGLSGLRVMPDGQKFVAVTDKSQWLRARIVYRGTMPIAIADAEMAPMLGPDGRPLRVRGWYDTEALAGDGDTLYAGIERAHRIVRFNFGKDGLLSRGIPIPVPPSFRALPHNASIECLAMPPAGGPLAGTLIVVSERGLDADGNIKGFLLGGAVRGEFSFRRMDDFDVSDCAIAPGGRLLVLERRFTWTTGVAMRIRSVPLASIRPNATVEGTALIGADMGFQIDNMEGLSVHRAPDGATVLTIVSDDNFSPIQRTLLLQFALVGE